MHTLVSPIAVKKHDKKEVCGTSPIGCNSHFVKVFSNMAIQNAPTILIDAYKYRLFFYIF